jgi:hypothetical protein
MTSSDVLPIGTLPQGSAKQRSKTALLVSFGLFVALFAIYVASPIQTSYDSRWSIATAMSFIRGNGGDLAAYMPPSPDYARANYTLIHTGAHTYTRYPIGAPLLAVPPVALVAWIYPAYAAAVGQTVPERLEKAIASFYGAVAVALFFWVIFLRFKDLRIAIATTLIFALGTSMWSTATRALWQHGPLMLMLIATMLLLLGAQRRPGLAQYASVPLALSLIIRPTAALPIAIFTAYVLACHRPWFTRFLLWAACVAVPWTAYNVWIWGSVLPPYYLLLASGSAEAERAAMIGVAATASSTFGEALLGNLVSPARGLFIFSPVLIFAISGFWLAMRTSDGRSLHVAFGLVVVAHWVLVSGFSPWWGGHSFGPRIMSDVLPFLAYFLAFSLQWAGSGRAWQRTTVAWCIAGFAVLSIVIHAQGALRWAPYVWNGAPISVDVQPARLWDWTDLQFTRR